MNSYNTRQRQRRAGKRLHSKRSEATGKDVTRKWDTRSGEDNKPTVGIGESLAYLEDKLTELGLTRQTIQKYVISVAPSCKPKDQPVVQGYRAKQRAKREAWKAAGLRADGKPRVRRSFPDLKGLPRKAYKQRYQALLRAQA